MEIPVTQTRGLGINGIRMSEEVRAQKTYYRTLCCAFSKIRPHEIRPCPSPASQSVPDIATTF